MQKITFENLPSTNTPLNANNLNTLQDNVENAINGLISNTYGTSQTKGYSQEYINSLTSNYEIKIIPVNATTDANGFFDTGITKSSNFILGVSGPFDFLYKIYNENTSDRYTIKLQNWNEQAIQNQNITLNICYLTPINS